MESTNGKATMHDRRSIGEQLRSPWVLGHS